MKKLMLTLIFTYAIPTITAHNIPQNQLEGIDQQAAIMMYLNTQCRAQLKMAQQAAQAFDLDPASVKVCLVLNNNETCRKKHAEHEMILHVTPEHIAMHPELSRYDIYVSMYMNALLRNSPVIKNKQKKNFLFGIGRTTAIGACTFALLHYAQNYLTNPSSHNLAISGIGASACAGIWAALFDRGNLSYRLPLEQITQNDLAQIGPRDEALVETIICNRLLKQGYQDSVILHLATMQAELSRLKLVIDASFPAPQKGHPVTLSQEQSFQLRLYQTTDRQIKAVEALLQGYGVRNIEAEIARIEQHNYETMVQPMLEQALATAGPLAIAREYRDLVHAKVQRGDMFTSYGTRYSTAAAQLKAFCSQHAIALPALLKEIASCEYKEITAWIEKAHTLENGQRMLKKLLAHFLISCELGLDSEIDGNEHFKKITHVLEAALAKYQRN